MPVQYSVIIKMGCGKKIAAAVHIDIIVFYFSKQYNEDKKGVCFYEVSEICRENGLKAGCVACAVRIRSDLPSGKTCRELTALTEQLSSRFAELSDTIKANEKRMVEIGALQTHINNYSRTRSVYEAYRKSGYSIKFFEEHREEIQIHKAAKKAFDQLPGKKVPTRQSLNEEYHRLLSGKKEAYAEYRQVKKDMQEYLIAKQTVEHILGIDRKNRIITQQQNLD